MSEKLKPCPFCGSDFLMGQEPLDNGYVAGKFYLYHDYGQIGSNARNCLLSVVRHFDDEEEAVNAWNRRHQEQETTSEFERLLSK